MDDHQKKIDSLLICNSNMFVPTVLTEVLSFPTKNYIVISDIINIQKFFSLIKLPNVIYHHYEFKPRRDGWFSFIRGKRELWNYISKYEIGEVVFFHAEYGEMANWLICKLSKTISVKYCKLYDSIPAPKAPWSFKKLRIILGQLLFWGQKMDVLVSAYSFPSLPNSFFKKTHAEIVFKPTDRELNSSYLKDVLKEFDINGNVALLTGTVIRDKIYTEREYVPFINELITNVGVGKIVSKCHPRYKDLYGLENSIKQVPSFIPGNLLLDLFDYYIGVESTLLVEAALAGKTAISIIDWLKPTEDFRKTTHAFFESRLQGKGIIHYPQSITELKIILEHQ